MLIFDTNAREDLKAAWAALVDSDKLPDMAIACANDSRVGSDGEKILTFADSQILQAWETLFLGHGYDVELTAELQLTLW